MSAATRNGRAAGATLWNQLWTVNGPSTAAVHGLQVALLTALVTVGLILSLRMAWRGMREAIPAIPDDALCYFQIARNVSSGHNVSFDDVLILVSEPPVVPSRQP